MGEFTSSRCSENAIKDHLDPYAMFSLWPNCLIKLRQPLRVVVVVVVIVGEAE
jgi:hypothetical protein